MSVIGRPVKYFPPFNNLRVIKTLTDFPTAVSGVITLEDDVAYLIDGDVNIGANRIVCGDNNAIIGHSPEISFLHNTLASAAMITGIQTLNCFDISFYVSGAGATILDLDAATSPDTNNAIDWRNVNFSGGDIGTIKDYSNVIMNTIGIIDKTDEGLPALGDGFTFDGTIGSVVFTDSIFTASGSGNTAVTLAATLTLTRRFRASDCAFVITSSAVGIDHVTGVTIDPEGLILRDCNFAGGATYLVGVDYTNDDARFEGCRGITNTYAAGYATMIGNSTVTTISTSSTPVKIAGATTNSNLTQKFTHTSNRLTYTGALSRLCKITAIVTLSSGNNRQIGVYIAKNGTVIDESETYLTTNSGGRLENGTCQTVSQVTTDDYFEVWVENNTDTNNVTVEDLSLSIVDV